MARPGTLYRGLAPMEAAAPRVDAVVVNRDRAQLLLDALRSVEAAFASAGVDGQIVVVDNDSSDDSAALVAREMPSVRWVQLDGNMGFPTAVNAGLAHVSADWVLLLNNDA